MDHVLAYVKAKELNRLFILMSQTTLFSSISYDSRTLVPYSPKHNLDSDSWFKIEQFSKQPFCHFLCKSQFDSKDYNSIKKHHFSQIAYIVSVQDENLYFQKITPSMLLKKTLITFGDVAKLDQSHTRLMIKEIPDAIYFKNEDTLIFQKLSTINSIFNGIDELYREATQEEVEHFLNEKFIKLGNGYSSKKVSKLNRKRIALVMASLSEQTEAEKTSLLSYINQYNNNKLTYLDSEMRFEINNNDDLKMLLFGIDQRYYTTPIGKEKRIANSILSIGQ